MQHYKRIGRKGGIRHCDILEGNALIMFIEKRMNLLFLINIKRTQ
jgi:hypothetical protein